MVPRAQRRTLAGYAVLRRPHPDQGLIHRPTCGGHCGGHPHLCSAGVLWSLGQTGADHAAVHGQGSAWRALGEGSKSGQFLGVVNDRDKVAARALRPVAVSEFRGFCPNFNLRLP
jgi:hypothetical protein